MSNNVHDGARDFLEVESRVDQEGIGVEMKRRVSGARYETIEAIFKMFPHMRPQAVVPSSPDGRRFAAMMTQEAYPGMANDVRMMQAAAVGTPDAYGQVAAEAHQRAQEQHQMGQSALDTIQNIDYQQVVVPGAPVPEAAPVVDPLHAHMADISQIVANRQETQSNDLGMAA